jgi:hypothetical protein
MHMLAMRLRLCPPGAVMCLAFGPLGVQLFPQMASALFSFGGGHVHASMAQ